MKTFGLKATLVSGAVALGLIGCGGSGGDAQDGGAAASEVKLSGTAATGLALADSTVDVKCASGTGTAVTDGTGSYTVTVTDGALPCVIRVTGTADGVAVTLHSVAEAGSTTGTTTTATANVTPLTEMVMAQLAQGMPTSFFDSFGAGSTVTSEQLSAATNTLLTALTSATGIDLGGIDPFKATLVPATSTTAGNAYDDALEALKAKISLEALPLVVNQIASASASGDSSTAPITLTDVLEGASAGTLQNCPSALSGKYRVLDFRGATQVVQLDFGRNKVIDGTTELDITPSSAQNCEFTVADGNGTTVVFGPNGVGALRDDNTTGFIFPVQSLAYSAVEGEWHFVESGVTETGAPENFVGKFNFGADRTASFCDYNVENGITSTCAQDEEPPAAVQARDDGGFTLGYTDGAAVLYGYRTPAGRLTLFGTSNPDGVDTLGTHQTHFVAFKPAPVVLPEVNTVRKSWETLMISASGGSLASAPLATVRQTITAVDSTAGTYSRVRDDSPNVTDVFSINKPLSGFVERTVRPIYAAALPGLGITLAIDAPGNTNFLYSTTVVRP